MLWTNIVCFYYQSTMANSMIHHWYRLRNNIKKNEKFVAEENTKTQHYKYFVLHALDGETPNGAAPLGAGPRLCWWTRSSLSFKHSCKVVDILGIITVNSSTLVSHTIHVWYIYLHLVDLWGKCRYIIYIYMPYMDGMGYVKSFMFCEARYFHR